MNIRTTKDNSSSSYPSRYLKPLRKSYKILNSTTITIGSIFFGDNSIS